MEGANNIPTTKQLAKQVKSDAQKRERNEAAKTSAAAGSKRGTGMSRRGDSLGDRNTAVLHRRKGGLAIRAPNKEIALLPCLQPLEFEMVVDRCAAVRHM